MMARFTNPVPLMLGVLALAGCPGDDAPVDTDNGSTGTAGTTGTTMGAGTVDPDTGSESGPPPDDSSSSGGPQCDPACPDGQVCVGGACFNEPEPTCDPPCPDGEECEEGVCIEAACGVEGGYGNCIGAACPAGSTCIVDGDPATVSWCAVSGCEDECDCPTAPEGSTANCSDVTGTGTLFCSLDCSGGGACPEDMVCFAGQYCVWEGEPPEPPENPEPIYGDCVNLEACDPAESLQCISDMGLTFGWCSIVGCADDTECQPPPASGTAPAECLPILNMGMETTCVLNCAMGQTCPDGMSCFMDSFCVWEQRPGYGDCSVPDVGCLPDEVCLDDGMMDPAWAVCSQDMCVAPADCTLLVPETGTAPVACGDPSGGGGADTCYLDCSGGDTCPDGMTCTDTSICTWPQITTVFADDFETGDLSAGWTLNNVDGNTPAMAVDFVNDAWVASDVADGGNFAATSTSMYTPAGTSDDWLISPPIMLGPNTRLSWESRSSDAALPDDLEVRISIAGTTVPEFEANAALFTVAGEADVYTLHSVDLAMAGYMNQMVHLAWRNTTNGGNLLLVDNVAVVEVP